MKNITKIGLFLVCTFLFTACDQHVVEYDTTEIDLTTTAQFQIHNMVPLATGTANNINKIEVNDVLITNETFPLYPNNFIPYSATGGKFFTTESGLINLKLYKGAVDNLTLVYDEDIQLPVGKTSIIVHDFDKAPTITDYGVFPKIITENSGETTWIKFHNSLYETPGVPTTLKLQYQYQYTIDNETGDKSEWINVGNPVLFGEATEWEPVTVNKTIEVSSGYGRVDYRIRVIGDDGSDQGNLAIERSWGFVDYGDYWTGYVGSYRQHILSRYRVDNTSYYARVYQHTAL
ncbi:hypothetical protein [Polaribacter atrinae]|uniref:Uncharacterized protein n=1 Tax=Polaribacter atrinae TaxID=1333662 RepID=A0A176TAH1_9FLAO|nr:hypothetical protein [Polaribacter atrinae]OAD44661.1 hypothetical protein LPB303_10885 [Polaribacter atrinae]